MQDELGVREEEDEKSESERNKRKRRRPASQTTAKRANAQRRDERKKRQKKKQSEELDAKISMPRLSQFANNEFSGAMLGDADDARRLMEFIIKRWRDDAKTDAAAAEHFPPVPSDETLAARVNEFLEFTSIAANTNVICAVCGEFHLPDNTDVFHLGKRTDEKTTAKPLGALFNLLKLLKNPKSRVPPPEPPQPSAPGMDILRGLYVEYKGVDADKQTITICHRCQDQLQTTNKKPARSLANDLYFGPIPRLFQNLNLVMWKCLQKYRVSAFIEKLLSGDLVSQLQRPAFTVLKTHVVAFLQVSLFVLSNLSDLC
jgi:hypothetical protein